MTFGIYAIIFLLGMWAGSSIGYWHYKSKNVGKIIVYKEEEKTRFMLELDTDPENIEFAKSVRFKIVPPE